MGAKLSSCFNHRSSLSQQAQQPAPVRVIAADGSLKELPASPQVAVSDVLGGDAASSFFVCNSDDLYFDEPPPALAAGELLQPGQIYFLLPAAVLGRPLSSADMASLAVRASADMASLAVRASAALATKRPQRRGRKNQKVRVVPMQEGELEAGEDVLFNQKVNERTLGELVLSIRPAKKSDEKLAARSRLKRALSIIQEMAE
ncbi:uncharacterized protein LOC124686673 [Lolium rigidum]|uniref:uncharacterized protein LOC124686673 n=1 Tax=Lolium rigidum TaxID=89674 RepID=UPI001F5E0105|nr:uncharacterized protein LOC124686673 [Lolium rigidum]